jgi:hypothetical protein
MNPLKILSCRSACCIIAAAYNALKPGGYLLVWLYGWEGNAGYLLFVLPLRAISTRLPHSILSVLCHGINALLGIYIAAARRVPLPLHRYMTEVIGRFSRQKRYLVIYDQLGLCQVLPAGGGPIERAGFEDIVLYHRHGYS